MTMPRMSRRRTVSGGYWAELKTDKDLGRERVSLTIQVSISAMSDQAERLRRGGVMHLHGALDATATDQITEAFEGSVANPGRPRTFFAGPEQFFEAGGNEQSRPRYLDLLCGTDAADMVRSSSGVAGQPLVGVWISLDALPKEYALEFVRGLHRGTLYNGAAFDPVDDTAPLFADGAMPRLPNIQADRDAFDIVSWDIAPGDIVVFNLAIPHDGAGTAAGDALIFHTAAAHGGGAFLPGLRRRRLTLRLFGDDVVRVAHPQIRPNTHAVASREEVSPPSTVTMSRTPANAMSACRWARRSGEAASAM